MEEKPNSLLEKTVIQQGERITKLENLYHGIVLANKEDNFELQKLITKAVEDGLNQYAKRILDMEQSLEELKMAEYTRKLQDKANSGTKGIVKELLFPVVKAIVYLLIGIALAKIYGIQI